MPCLLRLYQTAVLTGESLRPLRRLVAYLKGFFFHKNVMTKRTVGSSYLLLPNQQSSQHLKVSSSLLGVNKMHYLQEYCY